MDLTYEQHKEWLKTEDAELTRQKLLEIRNNEDIETAFAEMSKIMDGKAKETNEKDKFLYLPEFSEALKHVVYKYKDFKESKERQQL